MFHGWITQLTDPVTADAAQRWSVLLLPIIIATLAVYSHRFLTPARAGARSAIVEFDRQRLGDRRFSSARLWFSAFAAQSTAALGIETHLDGDDVLDLELIAIQETMIRSTQTFVPDEDHEALEWLTGHFRREMMDEESESFDRPALSSCWIAFGSVTETASIAGSRGLIEVRLVNAADLGRQAFITMEWKGGRGRLGRARRPLVGLIREPDPALLGDCIAHIPGSIATLDDSTLTEATDLTSHSNTLPKQTFSQRLLLSAEVADVDGPLTDQFVSVAQAARLTIAETWGDHWWTSGPGLELGTRSAATVRCQLFTEPEPLPLRRARVVDRDSTGATA